MYVCMYIQVWRDAGRRHRQVSLSLSLSLSFYVCMCVCIGMEGCGEMTSPSLSRPLSLSLSVCVCVCVRVCMYVCIYRYGGMWGDDIAKSPHMARIGGSVYKSIKPDEFYQDEQGQYVCVCGECE